MNPQLQMIAQLMRGRNPQEVALSMIQNQKINDPKISQLIKFAQNNQTNDFVNLAQEMFKQRGLDLNNEFQAFMQLLK